MTDNEKALDILQKLDFFYGQRAGRELWNEKPIGVQNEDIDNFKRDVAFLEDFINRQKAEIERLNAESKKQQAIIEKMFDFMNPLPFETDYDFAIKVARGEGVRELAKKLKEEGLSPYFVDNLVKKLTEGKADE